VSACTDITGFGLMGHLLEMMNGSDTSAIISAGSVPLLPRVVDLAASGVIPGGTRDNFAFTSASAEYDERLSESRRLVLNDAQTSGGLLISIPRGKADTLVRRLRSSGVPDAAVIGEVVSHDKTRIHVGV
jgi:selenophosphate synthase